MMPSVFYGRKTILEGGLRIREAKLMNEALLAKLAWRIEVFLKAKYYKRDAFEVLQPNATDSWVWKDILLGRDIYNQGKDVQIWSGNDS